MKKIPIIIHIFFLTTVIGIYLFNHNLFELKGILLDKWINYETTEGSIVSLETKKVRVGKTGRRIRILADINYNFLVDGVSYYSTNINFADDLDNVDLYFAKYPVGNKVTVFYDKDDPSSSVLEPDNKSYGQLRAPIILLLVLILYIYFFIYKKVK